MVVNRQNLFVEPVGYCWEQRYLMHGIQFNSREKRQSSKAPFMDFENNFPRTFVQFVQYTISSFILVRIYEISANWFFSTFVLNKPPGFYDNFIMLECCDT